MSITNQYNKQPLFTIRVSVTQLLEDLKGDRKVMGSIPVTESETFEFRA